MSDALDLRQFYQTFFEEADELLAEMERLLLDLDVNAPDPEHLHAIFRAAHSIKGGAATFGFVALTETTHLLENLLDAIRRGEMTLRADMIDIFLETKDVLNGQLETYRNDAEPAPETYARICAVLQQLAQEQLASVPSEEIPARPGVAGSSGMTGSGGTTGSSGMTGSGGTTGSSGMTGSGGTTGSSGVTESGGVAGSLGATDGSAVGASGLSAVVADAPSAAPTAEALAPLVPVAEGEHRLRITLRNVAAKDSSALIEEFGNLGKVTGQVEQQGNTVVWVNTTCSADDIEAVACFIIDADQLQIERADGATAASDDAAASGAMAETGTRSATAQSVEAEADRQVSGAASPTAATQASADLATSTAEVASQLSEAKARQSIGGASGAPAASANGATAANGAGKGGGGNGTNGNGGGTGGRSGGDKEGGSIRVGVEKVDQLINLVGELVITQAMLKQTVSTLDPVLHDRLLNGMEQLERNARDLQEAVMGIRMMPMDYVFSRFPRLVRDLAGKLGKKVELVTAGRATELDKGLIERIIDPLTHLVRNSLDHGIELPDQRRAAGKPETGRLALSAQHSGGNIIIEVADDGGGLNRERLLAKAQSQGIPVSDNPSDEEVWQLIFAPGFSTAAQVTDVSGRGVGMDVVKRNIQGMGGHVQLSSRPGGGTTTRIVLPLTLAILDGMSVKVGNEVFILPLSHVMESLQPTNDQFRTLAADDRVLYVRGEYLPLVELHRVFSVAEAQTDPEQAIVVIMQAEDRRFALLVDQLVGQHQVVVKSLEANYRKVPCISAATILGDGSVALIVDVFALSRTNRTRINASDIVSH